ncbi:MAG: hypothetical protein AAGE84_25725 [Cyanobacteria bacterium P01_G01_bin.39]
MGTNSLFSHVSLYWFDAITLGLNKGLVQAINKGLDYKKILNIRSKINSFNNKDWINDNNLISFAIFPIKYQNEIIGTLSVYTGYQYDFHQNCLNFLLNCSSILAAYAGNTIDKKYIEEKVIPNLPEQQRDEATEKLISIDKINKTTLKGQNSATSDNFD